VLPLDTEQVVTTQRIDTEGDRGSVTAVTAVTVHKEESQVVLRNFSGVTAVPAPVCITEAWELEPLLPALCEAPLVGVDTETTGLDPLTDRLRLVQFAVPGGPAVAVDTWQVPIQMLAPIFQAKHGLALHNAVFDLTMLFMAGLLWPTARIVDTQIAAQLLGAGTKDGYLGQCGLAALVERWLGFQLDKSLQDSDWSGPLSPAQITYAVKDALVTAQLATVLKDALAQDDLQRALVIECGCAPALAAMELAGLPFDAGCWLKRAKADERGAARIRLDLTRILDGSRTGSGWLFAEGLNWDSQPQVLELLRSRGHQVASTEDDTLATLDESDPLVQALRAYRAAQKNVSTYGAFWVTDYVHPRTQRIYADYFLLGTVAGRMSCKQPNVQGIPRNRAYRRAIAAPDGSCLVKADYSQIELRIAAAHTSDRTMLAAYQAGQDLHVLTAATLLGIDPAQVTKDQRQMAKAVNFGLVYGMGHSGLKDYAWNTYGVPMTLDEAAQAREHFFRLYPGLRRWHARTKAAAPTETRTLVGRRRLGLEKLTDRLNSPTKVAVLMASSGPWRPSTGIGTRLPRLGLWR
jgi:DNA polymerase-1